MKKYIRHFITFIFISVFSFFSLSLYIDYVKVNIFDKVRSSSSPKAGIKMKKGRWEYFNRMLRDPKTNEIPKGIRQKELAFAKNLKKNISLNKTFMVTELGWQEAGPNNVGGRTRALAIDLANSNTIIAGGASGGIWKSTNNGASWVLKSSSSTILSVTSIAQDPRAGKNNIWYYTTGEWSSNLAGTQATNFTGDGIYKSTDNGETWNVLPSTVSANFTSWDSNFDYVDKIEISKTTGSIFICTRGQGIFRSTDEGSSFSLVLGGLNQHVSSDISVAENGTIVAVISSPFQGIDPQNSPPGVYKSTNDGGNWSDITPSTFPTNHFRNIVEIAPSDVNVAYVITYTGDFIDQTYEDVKFHKINVSNGSSEDRSANMPAFPFNDGDERINTQSGYNLTLAIKPNDPDFVLIGATSLFRSTNGFATKPNNSKLDWIGGYNATFFQYPNFHSDIHSFAFDPTNPNAMWWGHDGGLTYTSNITNTNYADIFPWEKKNNGYNVTQFYHISIAGNAGDGRIMGGTQDNGTPYFVYNGSIASQIEDVSSGDGAYSYFGASFAYTSSQNGNVNRLKYNGQNNPDWNSGWSNITPTGASNQYFINPFVVDPNDENIMYYPAGDVIWRNNQLSSIPDFENGTSTGWTKLDNISVPSGYGIFALAVSTSPAYILYYGGSSLEGATPKIYRLTSSNSATSGTVEISIPEAQAGSYIKEISINPDNGNEILVVLSNYNITGLFHSTDGGQSYAAVEGNLEGTQQSPGPSLRSVTILSNGSYFLGTSIGVFSTIELNGSNTIWSPEGQNVLGNVIVSSITSRKSDGRIVTGTHGRGAFVAQASVGGTAVANVNVSSLTLQSRPGQTGSTSFVLSNNGQASLNFSIDVTGSFGNSLPKTSETKYVLHKADLSSTKYKDFREKSIFSKLKNHPPSSITVSENEKVSKSNKVLGDDYLYLDDGNASSDTFVGWGDGSDFDWYNEFNISGFSFELDGFEFYLRTEDAFSNDIYAAIYDGGFNLLSEGNISFGLSTDGQWYSVTLNPTLSFSDGETFYIELFSASGIPFPVGTDTDAAVPNKGFYYNGAEWVNLNTISGYENGAFLIRGIGTIGGGGGGDNLVTVDPNNGNIAPGGSRTVTLTLDAQNLGEGTYTGQVNISTNGGNITIPIDYLVDVEQVSSLPDKFSLSQNYPNPFNPTTNIKFSLPNSSDVSLKIFDMLGKEIATLVNEDKSAGTYRVNFDASQLSSGIYIYRINADNFSQSRKMLLLK